MKKISNICGFIGIAIYAVLMIRISNLCQYGGTKVDLIGCCSYSNNHFWNC